MRYELRSLAGAVIILVAGLFIYQHLLFPVNPDQIYPWGSDTWGHLVKAVYLQEQMAQGVFYPDLFPGWYNGVQLLRYHAPLPYYLLVGLSRLTPDIWWAGNLFLALCSLGGGLTFLLYRRWLGMVPTIAAGALFRLVAFLLALRLPPEADKPPAGEVFREAGDEAEEKRGQIEAALAEAIDAQKKEADGIVMDSSSWVLSGTETL